MSTYQTRLSLCDFVSFIKLFKQFVYLTLHLITTHKHISYTNCCDTEDIWNQPLQCLHRHFPRQTCLFSSVSLRYFTLYLYGELGCYVLTGTNSLALSYDTQKSDVNRLTAILTVRSSQNINLSSCQLNDTKVPYLKECKTQIEKKN